MDVVDPRELLSGGIFREKDFRETIKAFDWRKYEGKPVLIQGCSSPLPIWAYLVIMAELTPYAKSISFGEIKAPISISGKLGTTLTPNPSPLNMERGESSPSPYLREKG